MPLLSKPGAQYHYSQPNLYIAAFLIEGVSRMRFDEYLRDQLFLPLQMTDTSFVIRPGTSQYERLLDIQRIPRTPARVLPDVAPPLRLDRSHGADKHWDEPRIGWAQRWPEGGGYSKATDLLRFLQFIRTGRTTDDKTGKVLLDGESLNLVTFRQRPADKEEPVGPRTYAFRSLVPGVLAGTSFFGPFIRRNTDRCQNIVVLMQTMVETGDTVMDGVGLCDEARRDSLRQQLIRMLSEIRTACDPASPVDPSLVSDTLRETIP